MTMNALASPHPRSASPSMPVIFRTPPFRLDKTLVNWPNGSGDSPTEGPYSTLRAMGLGINPTPSNYMPPSTSPTTHRPRASPDGSLRPSLVPQPPSTLSKQPPRQPLTGGYMQSSSATATSTTRPRLSTIASATSRQRFREWWWTSGLPLDDLREPEPRF